MTLNYNDDGEFLGTYDYNEAYERGEITSEERTEYEMQDLIDNYYADCC